jgi:alginate O-acetyltransferase complex protein AlgI
MVFSSPNFLFLFLPLALAVCPLGRSASYLSALFGVSLLFYFWSSGINTLILLGIIAANWYGALVLTDKPSRVGFILLIGFNLLILFVFKYSGFAAQSIDALAGSHLHAIFGKIALPAGISFFVFQAISYVTDVRRDHIQPERSFVTYGAYQAFFPHLIAGPIVRYKDVIGDLHKPRLSQENFANGVTRFSHGLLKKVLIADGVAPIADAAFGIPAGEVDMATAWIGAIAYAVQIYFDFSGYSDMAIGLAMMFGIRFHENFARPYASRSITEFWRRWHISLSTWMRDYVYIPLGGNQAGALATYRNLLIVFAATGLWHGAAWTFLLWGLFHGAFLVAERLASHSPLKVLTHPLLRWCYCLPVVVLGWVLFRAANLGDALAMWSAMLTPGSAISLDRIAGNVPLTPHSVAALALGCLIFILPGRASLGVLLEEASSVKTFAAPIFLYTAAALLTAAIVMLNEGYSPFLYFAF